MLQVRCDFALEMCFWMCFRFSFGVNRALPFFTRLKRTVYACYPVVASICNDDQKLVDGGNIAPKYLRRKTQCLPILSVCPKGEKVRIDFAVSDHDTSFDWLEFF